MLPSQLHDGLLEAISAQSSWRHGYALEPEGRDKDRIPGCSYTLENQSSFHGLAKNNKGTVYQWKIYVVSSETILNMGTNLIRRRVCFVHRGRQFELKNLRIENTANRFDHANIDLKHALVFYQTISFATSHCFNLQA
jgi:hypothetical protein